MSSSRSRNRTVGAFGNPKARPIGFVQKKPSAPSEAPKGPASPGQTLADKWNLFTRKIGILDGLLEQPAVSQAAIEEKKQAIRGALNISMLMWNTAVAGKQSEQLAFDKLSTLKNPKTQEPVVIPPDDIRKMIKDWTEIKLSLFPEEKRSITDFQLKFNGHTGYSFTIQSMNLSPEGLQRPEGTVL